jgi:hypothetical protein
MRPELAFPCLLGLAFYLIPIIIGFTWVKQDADRSGQPGILWAILTIPLGWLTILAYAVVRIARSGSSQRSI